MQIYTGNKSKGYMVKKISDGCKSHLFRVGSLPIAANDRMLNNKDPLLICSGKSHLSFRNIFHGEDNSNTTVPNETKCNIKM